MSIPSDRLNVSGVQVGNLHEAPPDAQGTASKTFEDALVRPESGNAASSMMPSGKQVASYTMALGRNLLGMTSGLVTSAVVSGTILTATALTAATVKSVDTIVGDGTIDTLGPAKAVAEDGVKFGIDLGIGVGGSVVSMLAPYESDPEKLLSDDERVSSLSGMFDTAQQSNGVSAQHKAAIEVMDDLGERAYRRSGTDAEGRPTYTKMSKDEYRAALLHGAHVVVKGTETLEAFKNIDGLERINRSGQGKSSHYTSMDQGVEREQYGIDLPTTGVGGPNGGNGFGHLLTGKTAHGDTFFQLEGHGTKTWGQWLGHTVDLFSHLNSLANVGPQGVIDMVEGSQTHIVIAPD